MLSALLTVWFLHLAATATPGANTLLVMQLAVGQRRGVALTAATGVAVGSALWATLAVLGVSALFDVFPRARVLLQLAGAIYLLWLAAKFWLTASMPAAAETHDVSSPIAFRLGLLTNITNPKAALFFGSIFSAACPPDPPTWLLPVLVLVVFLNSVGWYGLVAYLFSGVSARSLYASNARQFGRGASVILGGFGLRLLYQSFNEVSA